jgi:hypothetical protein
MGLKDIHLYGHAAKVPERARVDIVLEIRSMLLPVRNSN